MASIQKRHDGMWRARYREDGGKGRERSRHFAKKSDAQRWLDEVTTAVVTGQYVNPKAGQITFRDYAEQWRVAQPHRATTALRTESQFRNHAYPAFGGRPIADILPSDIQAWVGQLGKPDGDRRPLAPRTIHVIHGMVHGVFAAAVRDRRIVSNPCVGTRLPKPEVRRVEPLTLEQVGALIEATPARLQALITLAASTGIRQGEALGVTLDRVDFLRRQVRIDRQLQTLPKQVPSLVPPKTAASVRVVPLPQVALDALAAHVATYSVAVDGFLFTDDLGRPITRSWFGHMVWRPAVEAAGLPRETRFHDLRHHYASLLIAHGESVKTVQARLGHASASETLDTYSHLWPDSDDRTREAIDKAWQSASEAPAQGAENGPF